MPNKHFFLIAVLFGLANGLAAQDTLIQIFLWKSSIDQYGDETKQSIRLAGEAAQQFNWEEHSDDYSDIIIHRMLTSHSSKSHKNYKAFKASAWDILQRTYSIHQTKDRLNSLIYRRPSHDFPDDTALYFSNEQETRFPSLHVGLPLYDRIDLELELFWSGSGECPEEIVEYGHSPGEIQLLFKDDKDMILMKRNISTRLISTSASQSTRIVEIDVQLYLQ